MKDIINRNYQAVVNRGLINKETTIIDFIEKIEEEYFEICNAHNFEDEIPNPHTIEETFDVIVTCINFLKHYGVDIEAGLKFIAIKNENRAKKQ